MRRWLGSALLVTVFAACGDDGAAPSAADIAGSYALQSILLQGQPNAFGPPIATGTLVLTATTYDLDIVVSVPGAQPVNITDMGTYTLEGSTWSQTSSTQQLQSVGTVTLDGNTLTVDATTLGQRTVAVWIRS